MFEINLDDSIELTTEFILKKVSEQQIYEYYLGEKVTKEVTLCRFHKDKSPSMGFYINRSGNIRFKCFACGTNGGVFDFVQNLLNLSFIDTLKHIIDNVVNIRARKIKKPLIVKPFESKGVYIEYRGWDLNDLKYWGKYYITLEELSFFNVKPANRVFYLKDNKYSIWAVNTVSNPVYVYHYGNGCKVYRPLNPSSKGKWFQNTKSSDLQGLESLKLNSDIVFITSSLKDAIILYKLGYTAVAPGSENALIDLDFINDLKSKNKTIILFNDSDTPGYNQSFKLSKIYEVNYIFIPSYYGYKDISDFTESYGLEESGKLVSRLLKWKIKNY